MKRVYRHLSRKPKHDAKSTNYGTEANKQEVPDIVDDIQWDQGDLGTWHKHNQHSNHSNQLSHVTTEVNTGTNETPKHRVETTNNEILTEWDSQFDFCFKDSPNNSPVKSMLNKENSAKSSKDKFRAVIVKGKDFVKSKVNSCRDRFSRNSMKEVKKRLSNVTEDESEKGSNSCGNHRGSYSGAPQDQEQSNTEQMGTSADLKTIDMSCDKDVKEADWSGQNGNSKYENEENFMILPEVYTKYNGVSNDNMGQNHSQEKTDKIKENNGDITDGQKNGNQVEIVVVDEEENDYGNAVDGDEEDQTVLDEAIPLGSEAQSFEESTRTETSQLEVPVDKKLKWLLGNLEQHSFGSDLSQNTATSNSSDISVDMLLNERSNDPEEILTNLGFGEGEEGNNPNVRIPGRFKADQSGAEGVSITEFLGDNPELSQLLQAISDQQEGGGENLELHTKDMDAMMAAGQGNPNYGNMLNSVMHGMKFLNLLSSAKSLNNLGEKPEEHPSILQNPKNREFLAQQGFYDRHKKKSRSESEAKANKLSRTQSLDASEKRKKFQATKSRNYSSLQNVPEQDEVFDPQKNGAGNYYSFGTSVGTGRSSSTDNYRPSMTSIETSTDSYDSGDSPGYTGRNGSSRSEPYLIQSEQMNIADSGIWNTEDSQRSVDEEYLSEFTRDSAIQRKSQVERMMSEDCYNVGDDTDILQSPPFSRTGSLESTLTASGIHKLETKSSTLKGHESFDDDVDIYSESYLPDKKNSIENGTEYADSIQRQLIEAESFKKEKFSPNTSMSKPESASGWKKFQRRYGVEMQINVPGVKNEADMANNNYEFCRKSENEIPVDGIQTDKPGLGVIGKIESVQSDSSGFAEAENVMPEPVVIQRVSSLGSSTESDQTFKSSITILPTKSSAPKMSVTSPDGTQSISLDISGSESFSSSSKVDIAVGTDDFSEYLHAPNICYHLHERDGDDSGTYSENNKSVVLTIELPKNWVNSNPNKKIGKPRVISHLYKEIGHPTRSQSLDTTDSEANDEVVVMRRHRGQSNYPLERAASDSHVPIDFPPRSSTPHGGHSRSIRDSIMFAESGGGMPTDFPMQLLSTPHGHSRSIRDSIYLAETKQTFFPNQLPPRSTSPTSLSAFSAFGSVPRRTGSNREHLESDSNLNLSSVSLVSQTDSVSSTSSGSLEYYKLMKLVNQPVSFKTDSKGRKGNIRFVPKFSVKEWTQLKKHQQLEEETKLAQHTLQRYKAELNMMESQFLVKTQLVKDDLSYSDREDVQELQYLFGELRKEMLLTEETLANRLDGINMGNDNYNPMLALDVIRKMTELLREQSYQQQMVTEKDEETMETTHSATWRSSGSQRLSEAKQRGSISDLDSEHSFSSSLSELKETILTEVRQELHDNTQWLHKELQKKERELNALKMELMSTNIKSGTTRKKHFYESDV